MATKIILLLTVIVYSIIAAQSFMYIIALKNTQNSMGAGSYIELRKLLDTNFRANFTIVVYAALILNLLLLIFTIKSPGSILFITAAIAFILLVVDVVLTLKGNLPINDIINTWTPEQYPSNWKEYRAKWLDIFQYRQLANITGFLSLLAGAVFKSS